MSPPLAAPDERLDVLDAREAARDLVAYVVISLFIVAGAVVLGVSLDEIVASVAVFPLYGAVRLVVAVAGLPAPTTELCVGVGLTGYAVYVAYTEPPFAAVLVALLAGWVLRDSVPTLWHAWR